MRLFGVMIAGGFSSEVAAGSRMLGSSPEIASMLAVQSLDGAVSRQVAEVSRAEVVPLDMGWRANPDATRPAWAKVGSWAKLGTALPGVLAQARRFGPDVIYSSQQRWDCTLASAVALALGKPQIVHLHYTPGPWLGRVSLERLLDCARVVPVSDFVRKLVIEHGAPPANVKTVLNSITYLAPEPGSRERIRAEWQLSPEHRVLGNVARFDATKGQRETIEAFASFAAQEPLARLVMVGDGAIRGELEGLAASLGIADRVVFTGLRRDVSACLAAFDVFTHPSYSDPCPLAVLEAQAAGLPVVAFEDGGIPEIVDNGKTGLLSPKSDVPALAASLRQLLANPALSAAQGAAGAQRMRSHFTEVLAGERFTRVVRDLLAPLQQAASGPTV